MIVRLPNKAVREWLYPEMFLPCVLECELEVDIRWDEEKQRAYIVPSAVVNTLAVRPDDAIVHKYSEEEQIRNRVDITLQHMEVE